MKTQSQKGRASADAGRHLEKGVDSAVAGGEMSHEDERRCVFCNRVFSSAQGVAIHQRAKHKQEYVEQANIAKGKKRTRWSKEDTATLLMIDMQANGKAKYVDIQKVMGNRTEESIRAHRKSKDYQHQLEMFRNKEQTKEGESGQTSDNIDDQRQRIWEFLRMLSKGSSEEEAILDFIIAKVHGIENLKMALDDQTHHFLLRLDKRKKIRRFKFYNNYNNSNGKRKLRKAQYAYIQRLYDFDRKLAAKTILSGDWRTVLSEKPKVKRKELIKHWKRQFEMVKDRDSRPLSVKNALEEWLVQPITKEEIEREQRSFPLSSTGPDGVSVEILKRLSPNFLLKWFNLWLFLAYIPKPLRRSKTVLIPKKSDASEPKDFRPISVQSTLVRMMHRILASRLSAGVRLNTRQKGFQQLDGCAENIFLLDRVLHLGRTERKAVAVACLDFRNAFGSIKHDSIFKACERLGIPTLLREYIRECYNEAQTEIFQRHVKVNCGVLQGDPLSPFLFNAVMDEVLDELSDSFGVRLQNVNVSGSAYADDVVLFSETSNGLNQQLQTISPLLKSFGIEINAQKCITLRIGVDGKRKKWFPDLNHKVAVDGQDLPVLDVSGSFKYLGIEFDYNGVRKLKSLKELDEGLQNLTKGPLTPQQRLYILCEHLLPSLVHQLTFQPVASGKLRRWDQQVRKYVRTWLKLPHDVTDSFIHARTDFGGLGVRRLAAMCVFSRKARLQKVTISEDDVTHELSVGQWFATKSSVRNGVIKVHKQVCGNWEELEEVDKLAMHESADGKGLKEASVVPWLHQWIRDGSSLMSGHNFVQAIKVRIRAVATKTRLARGKDETNVQCDKGCRAPETLEHVSQRCYATYGSRIHRHDAIVDATANKLRKLKLQVEVEPKLQTESGLRKPDIVVVTANKITVLDAQVVSDSTYSTLTAAHKLKSNYYNTPEVRKSLQSTYPDRTITVSTITINWRGVMAAESARSLLDLGLTKGFLKLLAVRTLEHTAAIVRVFHRAASRRRHDGLET